ncbi:nucleotide-sugar transporter-domain-containing protein [Gongronella butleri]|nr:nucleotide-sugar transporter-domain-containing protein [Gongronella butleri]
MALLDSASAKWVSLAVLVLQNSTLILVMRYTRSSVDEDKLYFASTAVVMSEVLKCSVSLCVLYASLMERSIHAMGRVLYQEMVIHWRLASRLAIPALLYLVQNQLQYVAATHLDAATFQVTYQLKILTTAMFSVLLLGRTLATRQWLALALLTFGIALVVLPSTASSGSNGIDAPRAIMVVNHTGLFAVLVACILSGLAGVYFERLVKMTDSSKGKTSPLPVQNPISTEKQPSVWPGGGAVPVPLNTHQQFWIRNLQLSFFSVILGLVVLVYIQDGAQIRALGFFAHYTRWTWLVITTQAWGGLIVALVVKYADNILKGFATSLSIIISSIISVWFFSVALTPTFLIGAAFVIYATFLYAR